MITNAWINYPTSACDDGPHFAFTAPGGSCEGLVTLEHLTIECDH